MSKRKPLGGSTPSEIEVREKLESLLPPRFRIEKASKYTESEKIFVGKEREKQTPPEYFIYHEDTRIAAVEVTTRKPALTYRQKISENKLPPLLREKGVQGYIVLVVLYEDKSSPQRHVWCTPEVVLNCNRKWEEVGVMWKKEMWVYYVEPEKWNVGLQSFVEELQRITGQSTARAKGYK